MFRGNWHVHKVPSCMAWIKYISTTFYCYRLLTRIQYEDGKKISYLLGCYHGDKGGCRFVEEDVVGQIGTLGCIGVLLFMFVFYRLLAYLALRRIKSWNLKIEILCCSMVLLGKLECREEWINLLAPSAVVTPLLH